MAIAPLRSNRTLLELKSLYYQVRCGRFRASSNRTLLELKFRKTRVNVMQVEFQSYLAGIEILGKDGDFTDPVNCSNRTLLELKSYFRKQGLSRSAVPIVPCWN